MVVGSSSVIRAFSMSPHICVSREMFRQTLHVGWSDWVVRATHYYLPTSVFLVPHGSCWVAFFILVLAFIFISYANLAFKIDRLTELRLSINANGASAWFPVDRPTQFENLLFVVVRDCMLFFVFVDCSDRGVGSMEWLVIAHVFRFSCFTASNIRYERVSAIVDDDNSSWVYIILLSFKRLKNANVVSKNSEHQPSDETLINDGKRIRRSHVGYRRLTSEIYFGSWF